MAGSSSSYAGPSPIVDFIAGTAGGIASVVVGQPFDTIKTRLQSQASSSTQIPPRHSFAPSPAALSAAAPLLQTSNAGASSMTFGQVRPYRSATEAFRSIVRDETFLGLFKGWTSPLLGVAAMNACIFGSYGLALRAQMSPPSGSEGGDTAAHATLGQILVAGCASGLASALITSPIELVKIREQLDYASKGARPHTWAVVKDIWLKGGIRGIYRGFGATCLRDLGYGPYFLCYEVFNRLLLSMHHVTPLPGDELSSTKQLSNVELAVSGALAGVLAWLSTFPIDCIKTRVQASDALAGEGSSVVRAARELWSQRGAAGFFRGVGPTVLRAIPVNATLFVVYESTKDSLTRWGM